MKTFKEYLAEQEEIASEIDTAKQLASKHFGNNASRLSFSEDSALDEFTISPDAADEWSPSVEDFTAYVKELRRLLPNCIVRTYKTSYSDTVDVLTVEVKR